MSPQNPRNMVTDEIIYQLKCREFFTPDWKKLNAGEKHLFFTDGVLRKQFNKHQYWLKDAEWLGEAITMTPKYIQKRTVDTPIIFECGGKSVSDNVWGDVWAVTPAQLHALDVSYDTHQKFRREQIFIKLMDQLAPFKQGHIHPVSNAFVYIGREEYFENVHMVFASHLVSGKNKGWIWDPRVPISY